MLRCRPRRTPRPVAYSDWFGDEKAFAARTMGPALTAFSLVPGVTRSLRIQPSSCRISGSGRLSERS